MVQKEVSHKMRFYDRLGFKIYMPLGLLALFVPITVLLVLNYASASHLLTKDTLTIAVFFIAGFIGCLAFEVHMLQKHLFLPLHTLKTGVQDILNGTYTDSMQHIVHTELGALIFSLHESIQKLKESIGRNTNAQWEKTITDFNNSTRLLIQRDLELTRANEELRHVDKLKSDFVSLVTHQLRTPLSGIRWSLSMILDGEMGTLTPDQKTYLMKTYESNNRMISLINDMLQADRLESGTLQFKFRPTNINYLMENVLIDLKPIADTRNISIDFTSDKNIPPLNIDPENMRIVLQNMIDNAIKYSRNEASVSIRVTQEGSNLNIQITDHGIGIPKSHQKNIFKRFFRAENAVHAETDGSGLGLYIVQSIIKKHRGTIRFESEENVGTTFFITLPISSA